MKTAYFVLVGLIIFPCLLIDPAYGAFAARRTAVVARGPYGGVVVAGRRTAVVRPGYYFAGSGATKSDGPSPNHELGEARVKPVAEVKSSP